MKDFSNLDGEVIGYDVVIPMNAMIGSPSEELKANFLGLDKKSRAARQARKDIRVKSKAESRVTRANAKQTKADAGIIGAQAQQIAAKGASNQSGDIALAKAIGSSSKSSTAKKGLSTNAQIGIGAGVLAILGLVGYLIYKKTKK